MYIDRNGQKYYKVALHNHTTISDGRRSPEEVAALYKANGYDAIAFTDHWHYGEGGELCSLLVISGCEYNIGGSDTRGDVMHIVGFGMKNDPKLPRDASRQTVIDGINEQGGIAVLAHPAWSVNTVADAKSLDGFAATEIFNSVSEWGQSLRAYSDHYVDACANERLYYKILATDDAHYYDCDECKGWVMVKADSLDSDAIVEAIKRGDSYATQGPHLNAFMKDGKLMIETSPVELIAVLSNGAWLPERVCRGDGITEFEYTPKEIERWLRVEARDKDGKRAWSNIIVLK